MEFHISRAVREAANVEDQLFGYNGNVVFANVAASRRLAAALNEARSPEKISSPEANPADTYNAGALFAMGLIDELSHALVAQYRKQLDPNVLSEAARWLGSNTQPTELDRLLLAFTRQFPNSEIYQGKLTAEQWLARTTDNLPNREAALEELLLLWLANSNPAFKPFLPLFADKDLKQQTIYPSVTSAFPTFFSTRPPIPSIGTLLDALRAPMLASPDSLTGQLDYIRQHWAPYLGDSVRRILLAIDTLREEDVALWMRFHPPGPNQYRHGAPTWGSQGFLGDEFIGFEDDFKRKKYAHDYQAPLDEYEAFSADQAWMPNVVLMAKSTYVWLEQLSKKYQRHIHRLDQIPDEELHLLADRGITGLWLIGLWERSTASRTIKRLRGAHDAVASAYSLKSYDIAEDLGGWQAYDHLKHAAARAGLRLASDMVPNHMGIDSPWVIDHPEWFIHRWESPFPAYSFNGPDLSTDPRVEIKIDDHYYDQTDAAVAFRLRHYSSGETRYIYHGNDGTTFAWNDTAQLDYSKAWVREHVIQTILHVARLFPIIRFDAAMVLAKRHVQRLWFPLPGAGGSIPSRAENAMSQEEFEALMPHEFWREVVDRVAAEVPGTLLLAEAFWLLEGYFVRTLGMHRVYNSAFMNMLRDEENAKYRSYLKKTIEFDPDILKRYVNFMSNPDERTAVDQFGDADKYFGVATLLATLPGLPMFGHGQIEGFTERYGMEFKTAKMNEEPKPWLVERHQREIAPLLKDRRIFAGSEHFILYDLWSPDGTVNENVFAYSNRCGSDRSLVLYNNKYDSAQGTIHHSAAMMDKASGQLRHRSIADGLAIPYDGELYLAFRDTTHNLEYIRPANDVHHNGLTFSLNGFEHIVLLNWRELRASASTPWDRLCSALNGSGVASLERELGRLVLRPLHTAVRELLSQQNLRALAKASEDSLISIKPTKKKTTGTDEPAKPHTNAITTHLASIGRSSQRLYTQFIASLSSETGSHTKKSADQDDTELSILPELRYAIAVESLLDAAIRLPALDAGSWQTPTSSPVLPSSATNPKQTPGHIWAPILAWITLEALPYPGSKPELFDRLLLRDALADAFGALGMEGESRWQAAARVRALLAYPKLPFDTILPREFLQQLFKHVFSDPDVRWLSGVHTSDSITYLNKEQFEELLTWLALPVLLDAARTTAPKQRAIVAAFHHTARTASAAAATAGYNLDKLLADPEPEPPSTSETKPKSKPDSKAKTPTPDSPKPKPASPKLKSKLPEPTPAPKAPEPTKPAPAKPSKPERT